MIYCSDLLSLTKLYLFLQRVFELDAMERPHEYMYMDEAGFTVISPKGEGEAVM